LRAKGIRDISEPKILGELVANKLITMGARALLDNV